MLILQVAANSVLRRLQRLQEKVRANLIRIVTYTLSTIQLIRLEVLLYRIVQLTIVEPSRNTGLDRSSAYLNIHQGVTHRALDRKATCCTLTG